MSSGRLLIGPICPIGPICLIGLIGPIKVSPIKLAPPKIVNCQLPIVNSPIYPFFCCL